MSTNHEDPFEPADGSPFFEQSRRGRLRSRIAKARHRIGTALGLVPASRYVALSVSASRKQVLLDRKDNSRIELFVRNHVDVGTMRQIWTAEDYNLDEFDRCDDLLGYYRAVVDQGRVPLILDLGANVGFAARYFERNYPQAMIVSLEPDRGNFEQARLNLTSDRVALLRAAIGSEAGRATVVDPGLGNAGFRVEVAEDGETPVMTVAELLQAYPADHYAPYIAKIDIEGFEADLFGANTEWIDRFPLLVVELHDWIMPRGGTSRAFLKAMAERDRDFVYRGENVFSISNTLM